jgi:Zn-dependent M28 family amino/carboxypeptidase
VGQESLLFNGDKAFSLLTAQCDLGPRFPGSEAHVKCRDWIASEAKKYTASVRFQEFKHLWTKTGKPVTMWNVIAEMNFGAPDTVLLLAHWDTRPSAEYDPDPSKVNTPIIGANDGASGVAVLLELMRAFKEKAPPVNVTFLFTDGEDLGPDLDQMFLGAQHFATTANLKDYRYGILLDMIGDKDLVIPKEPNSQYYAGDLLNRFYRNASRIGLGATFPNRTGPTIVDDHIPLNEKGLPTIDLIDFDYLPWHTTSDTVDKCSADSLRKVGTAVESFLRTDKP